MSRKISSKKINLRRKNRNLLKRLKKLEEEINNIKSEINKLQETIEKPTNETESEDTDRGISWKEVFGNKKLYPNEIFLDE